MRVCATPWAKIIQWIDNKYELAFGFHSELGLTQLTSWTLLLSVMNALQVVLSNTNLE